MELVLSGLSGLALIVVVLFILSLRGSVSRDRAEAEKAQAEAKAAERQAHADAARAAALSRKGAKLRCLGCEAQFRGPLGPMGCPECGLESLIVTEAEYRQRQEEPGV